MLVSWKWLQDYLRIPVSHEEVTNRLAMSGLNHESTEPVGTDFRIDLEVTSNRPDCLGHLGVAREISVLFDLPLQIPNPQPATTSKAVADLLNVRIDAPDLCPRYTARVITGIKVKPSPGWLQEKLVAIGMKPINNIVDITNLVMMENGQPLHAFDYDLVNGKKIIVRNAQANEKFQAIDHKEYVLQSGMCVIADQDRAIGLGGVMGGANSEIWDGTKNVVIEAAEFSSLSIRNTARTLNLRSDASYRFERHLDPQGVDWASRRCCQLILETAGGELAAGVLDVGRQPVARAPITLRLSQIKRILGIEIDPSEVARILVALGNVKLEQKPESITMTPPSWRNDLSREIDLVEEVARVHGYEKIPENAAVPMTATVRSRVDRLSNRLRHTLNSVGLDEVLTPSLVPQAWCDSFSPWSTKEGLSTAQPMVGILDTGSQLQGSAKYFRRSLIPSLLEIARLNEYRGNEGIELFEVSKVYLNTESPLPFEPTKVAICSERSYHEVKGIVEAVVHEMNSDNQLKVIGYAGSLLDPVRSATLELNGKLLGYLGEIEPNELRRFGMRRRKVVAELDVAVLFENGVIVPRQKKFSAFPAITRDFNFIVAEEVRWASLEATARNACGELLETLTYRETFRDPNRDGAGKKRVLLSVSLRSHDATLTSQQADDVCKRLVEDCAKSCGAAIVA